MTTTSAPPPAAQRRLDRLARIWEEPSGLVGWLTTVDHKRIGILYFFTSLAFFVAGGVEALIIRTQLIGPGGTIVSPETYNQLMTMHGVTMIFLAVIPMQIGAFGNYLLPLMIGARDMAFPRLNAFSYWVFLVSGIFIYSSLFFGSAPNAGWFDYVPLGSREYSPGPNIDFYTLGLLFTGIATSASAINFIVTIFKLRAPGMSLNRMPLFAYAILAVSFALVFALPSLSTALIFLELDRALGMHFFDVGLGGDPVMWQHLFWFFGHPEVYVIILPAFGIATAIIPTFAGRKMVAFALVALAEILVAFIGFGVWAHHMFTVGLPTVSQTYFAAASMMVVIPSAIRRKMVAFALVALAEILVAFIGFGVWAHHMFTVGLPTVSQTYFAAASMMVVIPSAIQLFAWITTIATGKPRFETPLLYIIGFIVLFMMGGLTGVMTAAIPFDQQAHDTYFIVAHFHYVIFGAAVFPVLGGIYYWFPKVTGRMYHERLGKISFWVTFAGMNLTFFPMHIVGLLGMPRRVYTYQEGMGWSTLNMIESLGAYLLVVGLLIIVVNLVLSWRRAVPAGNDPFGGDTLEWSVSSPPPPYNFPVIPKVSSPYAMWDHQDREADEKRLEEGELVLDQGHETPASSVLDADYDEILDMPSKSWAPMVLAVVLGLMFTMLLLQHYVTAFGFAALCGLVLAAWHWKEPKVA